MYHTSHHFNTRIVSYHTNNIIIFHAVSQIIVHILQNTYNIPSKSTTKYNKQ